MAKCLQKCRRCIDILTLLYIVTFSSRAVQCGSLSSNSRITAIFNQTATLVWTVNLDQNQRFSTGLLYLLPDISNPIINARIAVTENGKSLFGDRLSAIYNETEKLYTASLKNVNYNETYTFQLLGIFSNRDEFRRRAIVIANITGKPMFCGKKLEEKYTIAEGDAINVTQDVCGNPKPVVDLKIGSRSISLSGSSSMSYAATQYKYTNVLITRKDCGSHMFFTAENKLGRIKDNAMFDVLFTPSSVSVKYSYRDNNSCIWVSWDSENTGNCAVKYHLQFESSRDVYNTYKMDYMYCLTPNASNVSIWASYRGISGKNVIAAIQYVPPTTEVVIPEKIIVQDNNRFPKKIVIAVTITLAACVIINIITFLILKRKGYISSKIHHRKKQSVVTRNIDNYKIIEKPTSNYADLNLHGVETSLYADLTTTAESTKQGRGVAPVDLQKDVYENANM